MWLDFELFNHSLSSRGMSKLPSNLEYSVRPLD